MSRLGAAFGLVDAVGSMGRSVHELAHGMTHFFAHAAGVWALFVKTLYFSFVAPFTRRTELHRQLCPMMSNVGVRSFPICALTNFLMGAILVLQSGEPLKRFGQIQEVPGAVALSLTREIAPLLTAIIMTARVGASFTAVLASMKINEELMALEAMVIHPVGYLVAPRFLSMAVMLPCLTVMSYVLGMSGGAIVAYTVYDIPFSLYIQKTEAYLNMTDINSGLVKALVFGTLITQICCYFGLKTEGGSVGLGRNVMVAVVSSLVAVILADALATAFINNYIF
jgi:phospholipid/cholesterol/gamma-HCH transport system permease protein